MQASTFTFTASDGHPVFVHTWAPDEGEAGRKGIVHIAHGMAEHAARYERLAGALVRAGYVVYANDHRGHGRTARSEEDLGFFGATGGWARLIRDLHELIALEKEQNPGLPFALLGHSMGSFMAQQVMYERPEALQAVVLSGSNGKPSALAAAGRVVARAERLRLGARGRSGLLHGLSFDGFNKAFEPGRTRFEWLTRDAAEIDKYASDSRCGFVCTTAVWVDLLDALAAIARPENHGRIRKDLPVYVVAGAEDPVSGRTKGLKQLIDAYRKAGLYRVSHRFYDGARHEVFNEVNRDVVVAELITWLERNIDSV